MNEKVVLTQEQADAIERYNVYHLGEWFYEIKDKEHVLYDLFKDFTFYELMRAKFIGYEVKPKFEENDWVRHADGYTGVIVEINEYGLILTDIEFKPNNYISTYSKFFRHATEEEITEEKERRWWEKNGRKPWEIKESDCLISKCDKHSCDVKFVEAHDNEGTLLANGVEDEFIEDIKELKSNYKVFCFADDRKDV